MNNDIKSDLNQIVTNENDGAEGGKVNKKTNQIEEQKEDSNIKSDLNQRETEVEREAEEDEDESETEDEFYSAEEGEDDRTKEKEIGNMYQRT